MVVNNVSKLQELGLSEYEARIYLALLESHPLTAYEAAKRSGLSTSKVYGVISKLMEKDLLMEIFEEDKKRYIPQDVDDFLNTYSFKMNKTLATLRQDLKKKDCPQDVSYIWNIIQKEALFQKSEEIILAAKESLLISLWEEEYKMLKHLLEHKKQQGCSLAIVLFNGKTIPPDDTIFPHPIEQTLQKERGGRGFTLVCDGQIAISATINPQKTTGAWSRSSGFITLAEDYIKHDIYIMKIVQRFDADLTQTFGNDYELLRDIYSNKDQSQGEKNEDLH